MWLVMDTAGPLCAAGLFSGDDALSQRSEEIGRGHAERLMAMITDVMGEAGADWDAVTRIAVTRGPGSFTGLRVGLAAARGFGLSLGVPVTGVSVLDATAHGIIHRSGTDGPFTLVLPAGRGEVWCGSYHWDGSPAGKPWSVKEALFDAPQGFETCLNRPTTAAADLLSIYAVARSLPVPDHPPSALYLRAPDAKPQKPPVTALPAA